MIVVDERVAAYVGERLGTRFCEPCTALGTEADGKIVAGIVFNCWTGPDIHLSIAAERTLSRALLKRTGQYLTEELGCIRATIVTEQTKVVRLCERMGGQIEGLLRNHYGPGRDAFVVGVLREDWIYG